ncbi:Outer membrane protein-like protein [Thioalkalivibrio sulfidiphilus HL-EbGr7]|uniref:Outer membrane protein-like protein n=1 Tax=Thioalkalivibrio sulfidiphilus (strain HL-EbGR7) TaxID=396588 RepID=B8GQ96_THISH|nr:TolC family protein [Thioalkalivibrio sulfidiphilus]ACL72291.1 Outer membrane protein-like protein [Thioalkalivibrio sulfidiphilus HL-EbGr7]
MRTRTLHLLLAAGLFPALAAATPAAYDPATPVPPPAYSALPATLPGATMGEEDWRQSNDTVGAFTRGHMDVLRWEADTLPAAEPVSPPSGEPLTPAEALRMALGKRPDLFATETMGALERAEADIAVIEFSREVHRAWIQAVAAEQGLRRTEQAFEATDLSNELAVRMTRVGNWGQDRLLKQQLALSDAAIQLAQARQAAASAREALIRTLGLWGDATALHLPDTLPALPESPLEADALETLALERHPRLALAARDAEWARRGLSAASLETWQAAAREALSVTLPEDAGSDDPMGQLITRAPLLEQRRLPARHETGEALRARAEAHALAVRIRSQVREAYHQYRVAYDIARLAGENARLSEAIQEETLLQYNGMLKSTWDLLASARDRVERSDAALQALRDFWLAHANLQAVLAGADYAGADGSSLGAASNSKAAGGH